MDKTTISKFIEESYKKERSVNISSMPVPTRRQYDEQLVAWFDILGMREKIKAYEKHDAEDIMALMGRFQNYVRNSCEGFEIKFMQLSDGFILVADFDYLKEICEILCQIQWKVLINDKMLLRGALTLGKVKITDDEQKLVVGPGFIDAYLMESENAIFPRIIISNNLYLIEKFKYFTEDSDHLYFLDFLKYVKTENYTIKQLNSILETTKVIDSLHVEYNKFIKDNIRIAQKYGWLIEKLSTNNVKVL